MIDLKEVELLVEAGKLRNAQMLVHTFRDKQSSGYIDIYTLTLFARNIVELDLIFHDEEIEPNDAQVVEQNLANWVRDNRSDDEWWIVELVRLADPNDPIVHHYDKAGRRLGLKAEEQTFRAEYQAIREKLNEPSRE